MLFGKHNTSFQKYEIPIQITYYHNGVITIVNGKSINFTKGEYSTPFKHIYVF